MDMAFAASPTGSIGSRLPPTGDSPTVGLSLDTSAAAAAAKTWRYSTTPGNLLGLERDVREPVPENFPTLPELQSPGVDLSLEAEPLSSGFNSPVDGHHQAGTDEANQIYSSSPLGDLDLQPTSDALEAQHPTGPSISSLQGQMKSLQVATDDEQDDVDMEESPTVAHVKRLSAAEIPLPTSRPMSAEIEPDHLLGDLSLAEATSDDEIFLSEPAKAAAEVAKAKRGILRSLFHRHRGKGTEDDHHDAPESPRPADVARVDTPCPDPKLHELFSRSTCPNPAAHLTPHMSATPMLSITPESTLALDYSKQFLQAGDQAAAVPMSTVQPPMPPYQRATSTGSPMAFPKFKSPPGSPPMAHPPSRQSDRAVDRRFSPPPPHKTLQRSDYPEQKSEHFQPGWYYSREASGPTSRLNPMTYSFSTAAAKSVGQSAAPDSRIRDSYRTDTLTPLAKPPSRYRKTGITAMASTRGVAKYYGETGGRGSGQATRTGTRRPRHRSGVQFRSSPPPQAADMAHGPHKRSLPRDLEDDALDIHEDNSQVMELDDDTRAAIRMSLFGSQTPEILHTRPSLRELSPNVATSRKDRRDRKKRRPSYWDGDLKEIQASPAARDDEGKVAMSGVRGSVREGAERRVMTSPPKEGVESLKSQQVEIEGKENASTTHSVHDESISYAIGDDDFAMTEDGDGTMMAIERDLD